MYHFGISSPCYLFPKQNSNAFNHFVRLHLKLIHPQLQLSLLFSNEKLLTRTTSLLILHLDLKTCRKRSYHKLWINLHMVHLQPFLPTLLLAVSKQSKTLMILEGIISLCKLWELLFITNNSDPCCSRFLVQKTHFMTIYRESLVVCLAFFPPKS